MIHLLRSMMTRGIVNVTELKLPIQILAVQVELQVQLLDGYASHKPMVFKGHKLISDAPRRNDAVLLAGQGEEQDLNLEKSACTSSQQTFQRTSDVANGGSCNALDTAA